MLRRSFFARRIEPPILRETGFLHGKTYVRLSGGEWSVGTSIKELSRQFRQRLKRSDRLDCHYIQDEEIDGQLASLYRRRDQTSDNRDITYLWILRSSGLIVKSVTEITGLEQGTVRLSITNEFNDVRAPNL